MSWEKTHHLSAVIISSNNYVYNAPSSSVGAAAQMRESSPRERRGCCGFEGQLWSLSFRSSFMLLCQLSHQPALWSHWDTKCLTDSLTTYARYFTVCPWQMLADPNPARGMTLHSWEEDENSTSGLVFGLFSLLLLISWIRKHVDVLERPFATEHFSIMVNKCHRAFCGIMLPSSPQ